MTDITTTPVPSALAPSELPSGLASSAAKHAHVQTIAEEIDALTDPSFTWRPWELRAVRAFPRVVTLAELKAVKGLSRMALLQKGSRLSVQPVSAAEWATVCGLAGVPPR